MRDVSHHAPCPLSRAAMGVCPDALMLPVALVLYVLWVAAYFCFSLAPVAGAIYFHVGPRLDFPDWGQTSAGFLLVFVIGASLWACLLGWCCIGLCCLCNGGGM